MRLALFAFPVLCAFGWTACYIDMRPHVARSRGSAMLECPAELVSVRPLGGPRFEVQGCGKEAIVACDHVANGSGGGMQSISCHREEVAMDIPSHPAAVASLAEKKLDDDSALSTPLDRAAVKLALSSIDYSDCGVTGNAKIALTFDASGAVEDVVVVEGKLDEKVTACLKERFGAVKLPIVAGETAKHKFAWPVSGTSTPKAKSDAKTDQAPKTDGSPKPIAM